VQVIKKEQYFNSDPNDKENKKTQTNMVGAGLAIGVGVGIAIGSAMDNVAQD
jgi:hypothetical protein